MHCCIVQWILKCLQSLPKGEPSSAYPPPFEKQNSCTAQHKNGVLHRANRLQHFVATPIAVVTLTKCSMYFLTLHSQQMLLAGGHLSAFLYWSFDNEKSTTPVSSYSISRASYYFNEWKSVFEPGRKHPVAVYNGTKRSFSQIWNHVPCLK